MPKAKGLKEVSYFDIIGGGQVTIQGNYCYVAHMDAPAGTSILDISDPKHPSRSRTSRSRRACTRTRCESRTT